MRVLFLCHRIPFPPDKGEKIRAFHQLRAIAARHEVDLFTLADDAADMKHRAALMKFCRQVTVCRVHPIVARLMALPFLFTRTPLTIPYFRSRKLQTAISKAIHERSYDRIFVYSSAMAQYVQAVEHIPIMTDLVDVDSDKWRQYASFSTFPFSAIYRREARYLRDYERRICERSERVFVTTGREAKLASQLSDSIRVHVVPMGVNAELLSGPPSGTVPTIIFTGVMSYFPNQEAVIFFARQVLPLIARSVPNVRFLIVGRSPGKKVRELQRLEGVEVTGTVPDVRTFLARAHVSVAPFTIAAGIQTKILEALAAGLPVVATSRTVQALAEDVAAIIGIGDRPEELATKVVELLRQPDLARRQGLEGRRRVVAAYEWGSTLDQLLQLIEERPSGESAVISGLSARKVVS